MCHTGHLDPPQLLLLQLLLLPQPSGALLLQFPALLVVVSLVLLPFGVRQQVLQRVHPSSRACRRQQCMRCGLLLVLVGHRGRSCCAGQMRQQPSLLQQQLVLQPRQLHAPQPPHAGKPAAAAAAAGGGSARYVLSVQLVLHRCRCIRAEVQHAGKQIQSAS
jgi:hypothetical protein